MEPRFATTPAPPRRLTPIDAVKMPHRSDEFFALSPAAVAAVLLDVYGEVGEIRMHEAVTDLAQILDGDMGLSDSRQRQLSMMVGEACNLLERVGAVCRRPETADHRHLAITNRGHRLWAADDAAAALAMAAGDTP